MQKTPRVAVISQTVVQTLSLTANATAITVKDQSVYRASPAGAFLKGTFILCGGVTFSTEEPPCVRYNWVTQTWVEDKPYNNLKLW